MLGGPTIWPSTGEGQRAAAEGGMCRKGYWKDVEIIQPDCTAFRSAFEDSDEFVGGARGG